MNLVKLCSANKYTHSHMCTQLEDELGQVMIVLNEEVGIGGSGLISDPISDDNNEDDNNEDDNNEDDDNEDDDILRWQYR